MSKKQIKDIVFYCFISILGILIGVVAVLETLNNRLTVPMCVLVMVAACGFLTLSGIELYSIIKTKNTTEANDTKEDKK